MSSLQDIINLYNADTKKKAKEQSLGEDPQKISY